MVRSVCHRGLLAKSVGELKALQEAGLTIVYMGPESGDDTVLKLIVKGSTAAEHVEAAQRLKVCKCFSMRHTGRRIPHFKGGASHVPVQGFL